jgi:uncharacterized protein
MRALVFALLLTCTSGCSGLFYFPSRGLYAWPQEPFKELEFTAADGVRLHGVYFPVPNARGTVVQFHGNAGNLTSHYASLVWLTRHGYAFFTFDYRGYGASENKRSTQRGLRLDALAAMQVAAELPRARGDRDLIFIGQSLGGAVLLASYPSFDQRARVRAVVIESSFHSYKDAAAGVLWRVPVLLPFAGFGYALVSDELAPAPFIEKVAPTPLLVVHGTGDEVLSPEFGKAIHALAQEPKTLWLVPEARHLRIWNRPAERKRLVAYLDQRQ